MLNTFVIMGRPGSGKSVQAKLLAEKTGFKLISIGNKYREIATQETLFGKKIKEIMNKGLLGPSWLSMYIFQDVILNTGETEGMIFEGLGRKEEEAKRFNEVMKWLGRDYKVIDVMVSDEEITKRLTLRRDIEFRTDDDPEDIPVRIKEYDEHTLPAINLFKSAEKLIEVNGEQTIEEVFKEIEQKLDL